MTKNINELFSLFGCGYRNQKGEAVLQTKPEGVADIWSVYQYLTSTAAKAAQDRLRAMADTATREERSDFKKLNFRHVTFRGIFESRKAAALKELSPFIVIDIDGLSSTEEARHLIDLLTADKYVETVLAFVSPSGVGLKWVAEIPSWLEGQSYKEQYLGMCRHLVLQYGYEPDWGCSDVCRACFLGHDDKCYINNKYKKHEN